MALGITLAASTPKKGPLSSASSTETLKSIAHFIRNELPGVSVAEHPGVAVAVSLHPGAERIALQGVGRSSITFTAVTSSAGPGYHVAVCSLAELLADTMNLRWREVDAGDESGYWKNREFSALQHEMCRWLSHLCGFARAQPTGQLQIAMPFGGKPRTEGYVLTQTGPRTRDWIELGEGAPLLMKDFFPWWDEGHGATFHLGRALVDLWMNVPWARNDDPRIVSLIQRVHSDLETASQTLPESEIPWVAWAELLEWVPNVTSSTSEFVRSNANVNLASAPVGYRRNDWDYELPGGWQIALPGRMVSAEDDGNAWYRASNDEFAACSVYTIDPHTPLRIPEDAKGEPIGHSIEGVECCDLIFDQLVEGHATTVGAFIGKSHDCLARFTVTSTRPDAREWVRNTIRSIGRRKDEFTMQQARY